MLYTLVYIQFIPDDITTIWLLVVNHWPHPPQVYFNTIDLHKIHFKPHKCYVGQTKTNINSKFKKHLRYVKSQKDNLSSVVEHLLNTNYNIKSARLFKKSV